MNSGNTDNSSEKKTTCDAGGFSLLWTAFTLVPDMLLDDENVDLWLNFLRDRVPRDQHVAQVEIPAQRCACIYELSARSEAELHVIPFLIDRAEQLTAVSPTLLTAIRLQDKLAVACLQDGRLQLANIYDSSTKEQTLYWILSIYEQLHLDASIPIYIRCGVSTRKLLFAHLETRELPCE